MNDSKLIALLRTFNKPELRKFQDFVASPFFNTNEELLVFYAYLKKIAPHFPLKKIERQYVYNALFPQQKYDDKHLNYLMSFLLKLAEQFIGHQHYCEQTGLQQYHIINSYISRNLDKHYRYILNKTATQLEQHPHRNNDFYYQRYLLADSENRYFLQQQIRKQDERLRRASDYFDVYYLANKLKYSCELLDRKHIFSTDEQLQLTDEIAHYLQQFPHDDVPPISIYYRIFLMLTEKSPDVHFEALKVLIEEYIHQFPKEEMKEVYGYTINFCIRKINEGHQYFEELFNRYVYGLTHELLLENGRLPHTTYKNITKIGLRLHKFEWTEQMIVEYSKKLSPEFRETAFNYNMADLYYYKKELDKAQTYLFQVETTDIFYNLDARKMLMKIYYEQQETEALLSLIAASQIFLKRSETVTPQVRKGYMTFMGIMLQLARQKTVSKAAILKKMEDLAYLPDKKWLLKMLEVG